MNGNFKSNKLLFAMILGLTVLFVSFSSAQNYLNFPVGEYWQFPDARTLGLAGSGSVSNRSGGALIMNPAALTGVKNRLEIQLSPTVRKLEERRSFPIYNRIDDVIQQGIYVINNNWYPGVQVSVTYHFKNETIPYLRTLAVGTFNELDQDYLYEEEVRENIFGDTLIAYNKIEHKGRLTRYALGAGFSVLPWLNVGVSAGILSGEAGKDSAITFYKKGFTDVLVQKDATLKSTPVVMALGIIYDASPRVSVGSHLRLPYAVEYEWSEMGQQEKMFEKIEYPASWTVGLEYRSRQLLEAKLNIDFTYQWWSKSEHTRRIGEVENRRANFDDVVMIHTGIEHRFFNRVPFFVGMQYRTSQLRRSTSRTLLTAGTGFYDSNWRVDVSGGFSKLSYIYPDLFDDTLYGGNRNNSPIDDVDENYFFGMITLTVSLP